MPVRPLSWHSRQIHDRSIADGEHTGKRVHERFPAGSSPTVIRQFLPDHESRRSNPAGDSSVVMNQFNYPSE